MAKSTIGKRVVFKRAGKKWYGTVKDAVDLLEKPDENFRDLIQLVQWDDGGQSIRFCYYIRKHKRKNERWIFSNRPLSIEPRFLKKLLKKASKKKWFVNIN